MPAMGDGGGGTAGLTADLVRGRHLDIPSRPVSGRNRAPLLPEHGFDAAGLSAGSEQLTPAVVDAPAEVGAVPAGARASDRGRHRLAPWRETP